MSEGKFISPCPPPTARQREVVEILIEECAEVQQRATKLLRFGINEIQPGQSLTNSQRLAREVGDLFEILNVATAEDLIDMHEVLEGQRRKKEQLKKYMQTEANP